MRILVADDDPFFRRAVEAALVDWGHQPALAEDGQTAWQMLHNPDGPRLAILDWMMPGLNGLEVCGKVRVELPSRPSYLILLTARGGQENLIAGLEGGADDYLTKPFERPELHACLTVGMRTLALQERLAQKVKELEEALAQVQQLQGLLPICCYCKRIRDDQNYWQQVEAYVSRRSQARFSHTYCPECLKTIVEPMMKNLEV